MDQLIAQLKQRVGLSDDQARKAAETAIAFMKAHLPAPVAGQLDHLLAGGGGAGALGNVAKELGGFFGDRRNPE